MRPSGLGLSDQQLLREGHPFEFQLDAQIPTCHHERLGLGNDAIDVGQCLAKDLVGPIVRPGNDLVGSI